LLSYSKLKPYFFYVFYNLIVLPAVLSLHEYGHWFFAYTLGYHKGYVIFSYAGGMFILNEQLKNVLDGFIIGVGGGFFASTILAMLYFAMDWETDFIEKCVLRNYILHQLSYAYVEGLYGLGLIDYPLLELTSNIIYPLCLYSTLTYLFIKYGFGDD